MLAAASCEGLMSRLDAFLRDHKLTSKIIDWAGLGFPVIDRGAHAIYPLMVAARTTAGDSGGESDMTAVVGRTVARSALHVVPREWIFTGQFTPSTKRALSRCRSMARRVGEADLDWSWEQTPADPNQVWVTSSAL